MAPIPTQYQRIEFETSDHLKRSQAWLLPHSLHAKYAKFKFPLSIASNLRSWSRDPRIK